MVRKSFASTVLLYNDVPLEIVSDLAQPARHSKMKEGLPAFTQMANYKHQISSR